MTYQCWCQLNLQTHILIRRKMPVWYHRSDATAYSPNGFSQAVMTKYRTQGPLIGVWEPSHSAIPTAAMHLVFDWYKKVFFSSNQPGIAVAAQVIAD